jgi:hypothetical protein
MDDSGGYGTAGWGGYRGCVEYFSYPKDAEEAVTIEKNVIEEETTMGAVATEVTTVINATELKGAVTPLTENCNMMGAATASGSRTTTEAADGGSTVIEEEDTTVKEAATEGNTAVEEVVTIAEGSKVTEEDIALEKATTALERNATRGDTALQEDTAVVEAVGGGCRWRQQSCRGGLQWRQ